MEQLQKEHCTNTNKAKIQISLSNEVSMIADCSLLYIADTKQYFADWLLRFLWEQRERYIFYKARNSKYK